MPYLGVINFGFVLFYGIALSFSFADIDSQENKKHYALVFCAFGILQIFISVIFGQEFLFKSYPFLTHLPLFLLLKHYYKKSAYIAGISVLSAYLFCTPRKWIGTAVSYFWSYDPGISYLVQILITIPLLIVIIRYVSPYVARLKFENSKILRFLIVIPLLYYVLEYILTVYTNLLYQGGAVIVEFMDAAVVIIYFIFSVVYLKTLYEKKEAEVEQALFKVLADQSKTEIETLRESQKQAAIYRHDLRHHLNYLQAAISTNNSKDALAYIASVSEGIDQAPAMPYSKNESVNLILSSYAAKAAEKKIHSEINISTADFGKFSIPDLCSLLSNAWENAINACENQIENAGCERRILMRMFSKNNKLCIDIRNSYQTEPVLHQGFPVSMEPGHGFGTKSMAHVVEKYGGICQFSVQDGFFIFQATA